MNNQYNSSQPKLIKVVNTKGVLCERKQTGKLRIIKKGGKPKEHQSEKVSLHNSGKTTVLTI